MRVRIRSGHAHGHRQRQRRRRRDTSSRLLLSRFWALGGWKRGPCSWKRRSSWFAARARARAGIGAARARTHARTLEASTINRSPEHARVMGTRGAGRAPCAVGSGAARRARTYVEGRGRGRRRRGTDARTRGGLWGLFFEKRACWALYFRSRARIIRTERTDGRTDGAEEQMTRTTRTTRTRGWSCVACVGCFWVGA